MFSKAAVVGVVALFSLSGPYQQSDEIAALRKEIETLKAQQAAMQKDLEAIKSFLQALVRGANPGGEALVNQTIALDAQPTRGSATAKVTMVEVSDYHCPFCRRHMQQTQPQIDAAYIQTGKVRYVFVDYPIEQLHPDAFKAHEAANCAGAQGKYWEMHAQLFANPTREIGQLVNQAQAIGVNTSSFRACMDSGKFSAPIRASVERMQQLGVDSTPMFLIGLTPAQGQPFKVAKVVKGALPFADFKTAIDAVLQQ